MHGASPKGEAGGTATGEDYSMPNSSELEEAG
jgi:hypothetical protein